MSDSVDLEALTTPTLFLVNVTDSVVNDDLVKKAMDTNVFLTPVQDEKAISDTTTLKPDPTLDLTLNTVAQKVIALATNDLPIPKLADHTLVLPLPDSLLDLLHPTLTGLQVKAPSRTKSTVYTRSKAVAGTKKISSSASPWIGKKTSTSAISTTSRISTPAVREEEREARNLTTDTRSTTAVRSTTTTNSLLLSKPWPKLKLVHQRIHLKLLNNHLPLEDGMVTIFWSLLRGLTMISTMSSIKELR